ncbi:MAG TPA: hypothetical protein EYP91_01930, partial [Gammaproteobacteria bacterium]|nr:hypothetical protein [Gammaproteobacteria bacterium]
MKTLSSINYPIFAIAFRLLSLLLFLFAGNLANADAPLINPSDDAKHFAPDESFILFWSPHQKVSGFRNMDLLTPNR